MSQERKGRVTRSSRKGSPSRIPVPASLTRKRPAESLSDNAKRNATPNASPSTPTVSGFRRLELLAKAEAQNRSQGQSATAAGKRTTPWVEKYLPQSLDDLFVHKKKVEEVMSWLQKAVDLNSRGSSRMANNICVLSGPSGSGKTAAIYLIGKKLNIEVKEWVNPMSLTTYQFRQGDSEGYNKDDIQGRSQLETFVDFLFRTSHYRSLASKGKTEKKHRLVVVEDIPNTFYREPNVFHDILRKYSHTGHIPLVFIFTDSANGDHSMYKMFPKALMMDLNICNISFNPVAATLMNKFLLEICMKESVPVDKSMIEELAATSNGDLRCAVNNLQFSLTKESFSGVSSHPMFRRPAVKRSRKEVLKGSALSEAQQKDNTIQLFRALGKVLYAKRDEGNISECEAALVGDMESERRIHPLIEDPESICNKIEVSADTFVGFLHQNYPAFYGSMDEMRTASEYLSTSDFILNGWKFDDSGGGRSFKVREVKDFVGLNIAVRGLMHSNTNRISAGWKPLTKPLVSNLDSFTKESVESTRQVLYQMRELQTSLFTESIPFYAKLLQAKPSNQMVGRKEILGKGLFQANSTRAVTLDEKETVEEVSDVPEDEKESQEEQTEKEGNGNDVKKSGQDLAEDANGDLDDEQFIIEDYDD